MARLLASAAYDPATAASQALSSAVAMTALDTTNLRLTPTIPASGNVIVRARVPATGSTSGPFQPLLGVLEGATVRCRVLAFGQGGNGLAPNANSTFNFELYAPITGLSPGAATWDLAYGVENTLASEVLKWGGPNDASGADAWGAATFEVWDPGPTLLGAKLYDPSTANTGNTTALKAMTALDTTNLRLTVTAPASGNIYWRVRTVMSGSTVAPWPSIMLGVLESSSVVARAAPLNTAGNTSTGTTLLVDASGVMTGVSAGSHTYDAAYAVQVIGGSVNYRVKIGGPNDTTTNNAWGAAIFELWDPAAVDTVMLVG